MARNQWEITGPPEIRGDGNYSYFRPYPPPTADKPIGNLDREPGLDRDERYLVAEIMTRMSRTTASAPFVPCPIIAVAPSRTPCSHHSHQAPSFKRVFQQHWPDPAAAHFCRAVRAAYLESRAAF